MTQVTYPGVYIEEVPSANRTITGVATSITAFAGRTLKGPTDKATRISNFGAFEKHFGGLWRESPLSYAVRQFYQNGGADAVIVRIVDGSGTRSSLTLDNGEPEGIVLEEATPGSGGRTLRVEVTDDGADRHILITEIGRSPAGAEVVTGRRDYSGADADTLRAALEEDDSLVRVSEGTADFANLPEVAAAADMPAGESAARAASAALSLETETIGFEASDAGEAGNNLAVTVLHSPSDDDAYSLVFEREEADGSYTLLDALLVMTNDIVQAEVLGIGSIGLTVTGTPADLDNRPFEVTRRHLAGGTDVAATAALATEGLNISASNEGAWADRIRLHANRDTADPGDDTLFNLIVELLDDHESPATIETFLNVSVDPDSPRFVDTILDQGSLLVETSGEIPETAPATTTEDGVMLTGGEDGGAVATEDFTGAGMQDGKEGLYQLEDVDLFNLMVIPPLTRDTDVPDALWTDALAFCVEKRAMLIIDAPAGWNRPDQAIAGMTPPEPMTSLRSPNSVIYFPRVRAADPLRDNTLDTFAPGGIMAGLMARTDGQRGVWKAPAGLEAGLRGVRSLAYALIDNEVGQLNPLGINCLQVRPAAGPVAWGARTLFGADRLASEWKYLPVRRMALMIEESLYRGTQFAVFEPNDRPLWQQLRLAAGNFMNNLFRRGAFQGATPDQAYFVKCDEETTIQADIDLGIVNLEVGFSPLKPAEFVVIRIRQMAGSAES